MTPEQKRLINRLKMMKNYLQKWERICDEMGYSWKTTKAYLNGIEEKIDETIKYIGE